MERGTRMRIYPRGLIQGWGDKTFSSVERQKNNTVRVWLVYRMGKEGK